jgi:hypothetical protein
VIAWLALLIGQDIHGLRRAGLSIYWPGAEAGALLMVGALPLLWILGKRPMATPWALRAAATTGRWVGISWLGIVLYGSAVSLVFAALSVTVGRISGEWGWAAGGALALETATLLLPLAAIAPALAHVVVTTSGTVLAWLTVLAGSLLLGFPVPTGSLLILQSPDLTMAPIGIDVVLSTALATAGGFACSLALARRRIARVRNAHRNPG